jgi:hypothetical protein
MLILVLKELMASELRGPLHLLGPRGFWQVDYVMKYDVLKLIFRLQCFFETLFFPKIIYGVALQMRAETHAGSVLLSDGNEI